MTLEKRTLTSPVEVRKADDKRTVAGYAALFNSEADIGGAFREVIAPGAFSGTLAGDIRALVDHDSGRVIGRSTAGTLRLSEDDKGLAVEIDLPDTTDGRDLAVSLERGDISGMSFGFRVTKDTWDETGDMPMRTIQAVDLFEVSAVAFPAYDDTSLALRSLENAKEARKVIADQNARRAEARIAYRKASSEQKFRKIA
jgi:hypothetical protein